MVMINGESRDAAGQTLSACLAAGNYNPLRLAVERNGSIVPRTAYDTTVLEDGDVVEIVSFVGGG